MKMTRLFSLLVVSLCFSGCVLVPFVQAFKETGLTEGDRQEQLPQQVKRFSDARIFGNRQDALNLVSDESRAEISKQLAPTGDKERVVRSQIDDIEWFDNARRARVQMSVESFKMSQLIVKTIREDQEWEFSPGVGWLLSSRVIREE
jgi:hypothetical protein